MKYPNKEEANKKYVGAHKHGVFYTEEVLFDEIVRSCNMRVGEQKCKRHPLSFLVEAADSICYGVMDIEDGYNIHWYDFEEMTKSLSSLIYKRALTANKVDLLREFSTDPERPECFSIVNFLGFKERWPDETEKDKRRKILEFRVSLIGYLTDLAIKNFVNNLERIDQGEYSEELLKDDDFQIFGALSDFAKQRIISKRDIQELELTGNSVINGLLDILMSYAFSEDKKYRAKIKAVISKSRMEVTLHENQYKKEQFKKFTEEDLWKFDIEQLDNYSKLRLIVDFVASMTDKYSMELYQKFSGMRM